MDALNSMPSFVGASDVFTQQFLNTVYPALASYAGPPVYFTAVLYWSWYGYQIFSGHSPFEAKELLARTFLTAGIFATLSWHGLGREIYASFAGFMEGVAATAAAGRPTNQMLDALWNNVGQVSSYVMNIGSLQWGLILSGFTLLLLNCLLFAIAVVYMTIGKLGLAIYAALLPVFIGFFFFQATRQWAMNLVSAMLGCCLIYILTVIVLRFGFDAFGTYLNIVASATSAGAGDAIVITTQTGANLCVIQGVLILFLLQVKGWASALSNGATIHSGSIINQITRTVGGGKR